MSLSDDIVSQYLEVNVEEKAKKEETLLGTIVSYNGKQYVKLDGSDQLAPIDSTSSVDTDDRVTVLLKNHTAIVTGNLSDPSAKNSKMTEISDRVDEFGNIMAYSITTENISPMTSGWHWYMESCKHVDRYFTVAWIIWQEDTLLFLTV